MSLIYRKINIFLTNSIIYHLKMKKLLIIVFLNLILDNFAFAEGIKEDCLNSTSTKLFEDGRKYTRQFVEGFHEGLHQGYKRFTDQDLKIYTGHWNKGILVSHNVAG